MSSTITHKWAMVGSTSAKTVQNEMSEQTIKLDMTSISLMSEYVRRILNGAHNGMGRQNEDANNHRQKSEHIGKCNLH